MFSGADEHSNRNYGERSASSVAQDRVKEAADGYLAAQLKKNPCKLMLTKVFRNLKKKQCGKIDRFFAQILKI